MLADIVVCPVFELGEFPVNPALGISCSYSAQLTPLASRRSTMVFTEASIVAVLSEEIPLVLPPTEAT